MRYLQDKQLWLVPSSEDDASNLNPVIAELMMISEVLESCPRIREVYERVKRDLVGEKRDDCGTTGLSAEQAFRAALVKEKRGLTYRELEFYLQDSLTLRSFVRLGPTKGVSKSVLAELRRCFQPHAARATSTGATINLPRNRPNSKSTGDVYLHVYEIAAQPRAKQLFGEAFITQNILREHPAGNRDLAPAELRHNPGCPPTACLQKLRLQAAALLVRKPEPSSRKNQTARSFVSTQANRWMAERTN